jgi:hypothetical protein
MKVKKVTGLVPASLLFVGASLGSFSARAQSASPQETLNRYVSDLQKNPDATARDR